MMETCPHCGAVITRPGAGRPPRHSALDLQDCLGSHELTSGEFQRRAAETVDISRATFFRLLERARLEWLFRQRLTDRRWDRESKTYKTYKAFFDLPNRIRAPT